MDQTYSDLRQALTSAEAARDLVNDAGYAYKDLQPKLVASRLREAARRLIETLSWIERIREREETK